MKPDIFIDTSGFYALLVKNDDMHQQAKRVMQRASESNLLFYTTDYILDETLTLLKARKLIQIIPDFMNIIDTSNICLIEWMDADRFNRTINYFIKYMDHSYSFTDCFSFIMMQQLELREALTKDRHFQDAGFISLLT